MINKLEIQADKSLNFVKEKKIYIYGEFDASLSRNVLPELSEIIEDIKDNKKAKIKIYIDSNGGYTSVLKSMIGMIEVAKKENIIIETHAYARAYSCASMLACSGTKGYRYISSNTEHLCHLGAASTGYNMTDKQLERNVDYVKRHFNFIRNTYKKYASVKNLEKVMQDDCYYIHGKDIITNGLADKLID